jgi:hypothetical protein
MILLVIVIIVCDTMELKPSPYYRNVALFDNSGISATA